jgi:hypothetical protein
VLQTGAPERIVIASPTGAGSQRPAKAKIRVLPGSWPTLSTVSTHLGHQPSSYVA